ncbi:MAG: hypothetical protein HKN41_06295 [Ilumatobacter sp.]|nr:hypothetical protein [Ilumatobacter sp.]
MPAARRLLLLVPLIAVLTACRLDVTVDVVMDNDGTGIVTVVAIADAELMAQVPDLVDDLRLDDAIANGWTVTGPVTAADGSATISLTHDFASAEELANVLNSIGPPLTRMAAARTTVEEQTTNAINGELQLANGYESFADADLLTLVGGLPFGEEIAADGRPPAEAMSFTFRVALPGELVQAETGTEVDDGVIEWRAPLDGTTTNLLTSTVQRPASEGGAWAQPLATGALVALVAWVVIAGVFIVVVAVARRNRQRRRRERALRNLR